ncbi:MAG: TrmH family RNA methyltransferase [Methylocystaceae bacterium]
MVLITSPDNELIKKYKKLKMKKYREETGLFLAEGSRLVEEALKAEAVQELLIGEGNSFTAAVGINIIQVSQRLLDSLSDTESSQGVIAVCRDKKYPKSEQLAVGPWVAVDSLADPGNLGTIIRTAWGTGMKGLILIGDCVDPYNSKVVRASMGGIFHVPIIYADASDIKTWQAQGHQVIVAAAAAAHNYYDVNYPANLILVVGSEARGVSAPIESIANLSVKLPLAAGVDSINAAVCAGVLMYEIKRQFH